MPRPPLVSVAICLFNSTRFIDDTLASVFAQTFEDYEVVLVDDGSTDGCAESIERRYRDPRLTLIRQRHQGLSFARRATIDVATGEYLAFLDHDDLWVPDKLERQVAAARANSHLALLFSDCLYIDERGQPLRRLSEEYSLCTLDAARGYEELLRRGCFVWQSTAFARTAALRAVNSFDPAYPYIADYDTWLKMARRYAIHYTPDVLAKWRVHATQFTQRCPEITLADHRRLLSPLVRTASIPPAIRVALGDRLLGQHRVSCRILLKQGRYALAARAGAGMLSQPDRLEDYVRDKVYRIPIAGRWLAGIYAAARSAVLRVADLFFRVAGRLSRESASPATHVWVDGSALGEAPTGYFNFVTELIRALNDGASTVHVTSSSRGREALLGRLGEDARGLRFHRPTLRPRPMGRPPHPKTIEVLLWRGRFRWSGSHRVAVVHDLTTRIHPEFHTARNIADFEQFVAYAERHAHAIATPSAHSKKDIVDRLGVFPGSVSVIPMPVHPSYTNPSFDERFIRASGITQPYLLSVGCIEPRKNLRRLVRAFEMLRDEPALRDHVLVFAGPQGWDDDFPRFLAESDMFQRIRPLGLAPQEHLPSLYHFASAVVYPSLYEGFGLPVLEAMCCSSIVLASGASSLPEVLGDAGVLFDPHRTEAVAAAILQAVSMTPAEAADCRRRARTRAERLLERLRTMPLLPGLPAHAVVTHA